MAFTVNYSESGHTQQEVAAAAATLTNIPELANIHLIQKEGVGNTSFPSLVLVGIGGSSRGARAILEALRPDFPVHYLDMIDARALQHVQAQHVIIVSKSGQTLETLVNMQALLPQLTSCMVVADEGTPLAQFAQQKGFTYVVSPKDIGGRFSLFTSVGLVPMAAAGIDVTKFCVSAEKMYAACSTADVASNPALYSAALTYLQLKNGKALHVFFHTDTRLRGLGFWWRQLVAESLGKDGKGITPLVSDPTDLHAMFQRYAQGPKDVYTTLVSFDAQSDVALKETPLLPGLANKKIDEIAGAVTQGIYGTYAKLGLPIVHIHLDTCDEESLGEFCMWKMMETIYLAQLMGVDPFTQPAVESYKSEIKKDLSL